MDVQVKNPRFIRDIVVVHFSDCDGLASTGRVSQDPLCCVRNFKFTSPVKEHAHHLLTVSMLEELVDAESNSDSGTAGSEAGTGTGTGGAGSGAGGGGVLAGGVPERHGVGPYILTEASLRTWGFPVPLSAPSAEQASSSSSSSSSAAPCDDAKVAGEAGGGKKRKLSEVSSSSSSSVTEEKVGLQGYLGGSVRLLSLAVARDFLGTPEQSGPTCWVAPPVVYNGNDDAIATMQAKAPLLFRQTLAKTCDELYCNGIEKESSSSLDLSIMALDCEMCDTVNGPELTRISLVDYNGMVLLDTLVKPYSPIVNYKEAYSGISATLLDPVTIRLEQVQVALMSVISSSSVLVGHSLENDLYALRMTHKRCVDTAVMYAHPIGFPHRHKLKYLAKEFLKINIQNASSNLSGKGHSSVEDARVALQLMKLKVEHGPLFGIKNHQDVPREPLVAKIPESVKSAFFFSSEDMLKRRRSCVGGGVQSSCSADSSGAVDKALHHLGQVSRRGDLLRDRNFTYIEISCDGHKDSNKSSDDAKLNSMEQQSQSEFKFYSYVDRIKDCLSTHSNRDVLMLVSSQTSVQEVIALQNQKRACTKAMSASSWNERLDDLLERRKVVSSFSDVEIMTIPARSSDRGTDTE
jgi:DNA polymerase III epsilon subunit-like protein